MLVAALGTPIAARTWDCSTQNGMLALTFSGAGMVHPLQHYSYGKVPTGDRGAFLLGAFLVTLAVLALWGDRYEDDE